MPTPRHTQRGEAAATAYRSVDAARPDHGTLVIAFWRTDKGQGVKTGTYSEKSPGLLIDNSGTAHDFRRFREWAYVFYPPQETL